MTEELPPPAPAPYVASPGDLANPAAALSPEEKNWGMIAHLSGLTGLVTGGFVNIIGPLVVWLIKKESSPFTAKEAKEALNFQITWTGAAIVLGILSIPLILAFGLGLITLFGSGLIILASWILSVVAGIQAGEGKSYRYPFTIRFIK